MDEIGTTKMHVGQKRFHFFPTKLMTLSLATEKIEFQIPFLILRVEREAEANDADKLITIFVTFYTLYYA